MLMMLKNEEFSNFCKPIQIAAKSIGTVFYWSDLKDV